MSDTDTVRTAAGALAGERIEPQKRQGETPQGTRIGEQAGKRDGKRAGKRMKKPFGKRRRDREPSFEQTPRRMLFGVALTLAGGVLWGVNGSVSKLVMDGYGVSPLWFACVRQTIAGMLFLLCAAVIAPRSLKEAVGNVRSYPWYIVCALCCVTLEQVGYLFCVHWTNAGTATVLQTVNLVMVLGYVCVRGRRRPSWVELVGVVMAFAGVFLLATGGNFSTLSMPVQALVWGLLNAFACACLAIMPVKLIAQYGELVVNGVLFLISGLLLMPFVRPWEQVPAMDARGWALTAVSIVVGAFLAFWLFMAGVARVGSMRATLLATIEPVVATITAVAWTGAVFTPADLIGFVLIIVMVFLVH